MSTKVRNYYFSAKSLSVIIFSFLFYGKRVWQNECNFFFQNFFSLNLISVYYKFTGRPHKKHILNNNVYLEADNMAMNC